VARTILHVDLDAFYASVEQRDDPRLRGRPVIVGGRSRRGVVCAASYEARPFGVRSAMPMVTALEKCPDAVVVSPRMGHYAVVSGQFFAILDSLSPLVEGLSLDEAFLDVTGEERLFGDGPAIARRIKQRVRDELSLVASVGVAPVKHVAKIASDLRKPDGLVVVGAGAGEVESFLAPLPVSRLWGVGRVTGEALGRAGIATIGELRRVGERALAARVGADSARHLLELARGEDARPVEPDRAPVSLGSEDTFERDLYDRERLWEMLLLQADSACARLRGEGLRARTVTVKIKYGNHELVTRRTTLPRATADGRLVGTVARELLAAVPAIEQRGVRLTGISLSGLGAAEAARPRQLALGLPEERAEAAAAARGEALGAAIDQIAARFGKAAVQRAVHLEGTEAAPDQPKLPVRGGRLRPK